MTVEPAVLVRVEGRLGRITLNRPAAINALTGEMVSLIADALARWKADDAVGAVLLDGAGERGFCAGGDVVALAESASRGDDEADAFWRAEYRLNATIARYPKPVVALMDGLVLGGGVGLACHASHRVVTERSRVGLPETGIGFLPDVGATWLLARAPGELGLFAALTGRFLTGPEAIELGLADVLVESASLERLSSALRDAAPDEVFEGFTTPVPPSGLLDRRRVLDAALAGDDLDAMLERLDAAGEGEAADAIRSKSPTASAVTIAAIRSAASAGLLEDALVTELRAAVRLAHAPDFAEGVRAQLVDKDRAPRWAPAVRTDDIPGFLAPLERDLTFPSS